MWCSGPEMFSIRTTPRRTMSVEESVVEGATTPGQSIR